MYTHILVPTDGSPLSDYAVDQALVLAEALDARVTLLTVVEPFRPIAYVPEQVVESRESYDESTMLAAEKRLQDASAKAEAFGIAHATQVAVSGDPHEAIMFMAATLGCDLIAMASHGRRGVKALVLGSVTAKVLTQSQVPVLVYRQAAE